VKKILLPIIFIFANTVFAGTLVPESDNCPAHEVINEQEKRTILSSVKTPSQVDVIKQYELQPQVKFNHNNAEIILSKKFSRPDKDRQHALAFIKINGEVFPRVLYHSNSHGTFRVIDGVLGGWYSKGPGQAFISAPFKISKFLLNDCISYGPKREKKELEDLLALSDDHLFYYHNYDAYKDSVTSGLSSPSLPMVIDGNGSLMRSPTDIVIKNGLEPDYTQLITKFETVTKAAGPVKVYTYRSKNNLVDYMIMQGQDSKIWVAEINAFGENLNKFGIAFKQYDFSDLLQPRWEYPDEVAIGFESSLNSPYRSKYASNWNYLREVKVIQDWYESQGLSVPEEEQ